MQRAAADAATPLAPAATAAQLPAAWSIASAPRIVKAHRTWALISVEIEIAEQDYALACFETYESREGGICFDNFEVMHAANRPSALEWLRDNAADLSREAV